MLGGVLLAGFLGVVQRVQMMAVRGVRVLGRLGMVLVAVLFRCVAMMLRGVLVVLGGLLVMVGDAGGV